MPWQSSCWLSQDVSPLYGNLQKVFGCIVMRSFAEKPFPLQGNSVHARPSCSARSLCKPLLPPAPAKQSHSWHRTGVWDVCWTTVCAVLLGRLSPARQGRVWGRSLPLGCAPPGWAAAPALQAGSNPASHSLVNWERRRNFLACTFPLCSSIEPGLKAIVVFAPYGGNN